MKTNVQKVVGKGVLKTTVEAAGIRGDTSMARISEIATKRVGRGESERTTTAENRIVAATETINEETIVAKRKIAGDQKMIEVANGGALKDAARKSARLTTIEMTKKAREKGVERKLVP